MIWPTWYTENMVKFMVMNIVPKNGKHDGFTEGFLGIFQGNVQYLNYSGNIDGIYRYPTWSDIWLYIYIYIILWYVYI
jgi:hypothetical protein